MILSEIRAYFADNHTVSLTDLCNRFGVEPDAMRRMIGQWERKGKVRKTEQTGCCPNCCKSCNSEHLEIYEWVG